MERCKLKKVEILKKVKFGDLTLKDVYNLLYKLLVSEKSLDLYTINGKLKDIKNKINEGLEFQVLRRHVQLRGGAADQLGQEHLAQLDEAISRRDSEEERGVAQVHQVCLSDWHSNARDTSRLDPFASRPHQRFPSNRRQEEEARQEHTGGWPEGQLWLRVWPCPHPCEQRKRQKTGSKGGSQRSEGSPDRHRPQR